MKTNGKEQKQLRHRSDVKNGETFYTYFFCSIKNMKNIESLIVIKLKFRTDTVVDIISVVNFLKLRLSGVISFYEARDYRSNQFIC